MCFDLIATEKELLGKIANGSQPAFESLMNRYSDLLGRYIYTLTHSREAAEEIVQDVFLKIWTVKERLTEVQDFKKWLFNISKNHTLNALRKVIKEKADYKAFVKESYILDKEENDYKNGLIQLVESAITRLPPQQKMAYMLAQHKGYSYKEVGSKMNLSPQTIKKYLQYARSFVYTEIEKRVIPA
jgi:RNA polymerase sigma factor (sigma-70 family)